MKHKKEQFHTSLYPESKSYYLKEIDNFAQVFAHNSACKTDYQKLDKEMNWRNVMVIIVICMSGGFLKNSIEHKSPPPLFKIK